MPKPCRWKTTHIYLLIYNLCFVLYHYIIVHDENIQQMFWREHITFIASSAPGTRAIVLKRCLMGWRIFILFEEKPTIGGEHWTGFAWHDDISLFKLPNSSIQSLLNWLKWNTIPSQMGAWLYICPIWLYNH